MNDYDNDYLCDTLILIFSLHSITLGWGRKYSTFGILLLTPLESRLASGFQAIQTPTSRHPSTETIRDMSVLVDCEEVDCPCCEGR